MTPLAALILAADFTAAPIIIEHDAAGRPILPADLTDDSIAAYIWAVVDAADPSIFFALPLQSVAAELSLRETVTPEAAKAWQGMDPAARLQVITDLAADPFLSLSEAATDTR